MERLDEVRYVRNVYRAYTKATEETSFKYT